MAIITMHSGVNVSGMPLPVAAVVGVVGVPAVHRAGWAPAAAAPQHKRRTAAAPVASVKRGTT